jgi:dihydroorotate dehydrogenase (NAD+) catalytic subunit
VKQAIHVPLIAKLTPAAPDIGRIARACEDAGADAICAINTAGPGMVIDIEAKMPVLAFKKGGLSGPMIKPIAVRCVYDIYTAVSIPIIGLGGITTGEDAVEMFMAGATLAGMGSAVRYRGIQVFDQVNQELNTWLADHHTTRDAIIGAAHGRLVQTWETGQARSRLPDPKIGKEPHDLRSETCDAQSGRKNRAQPLFCHPVFQFRH